MLPLEMYIIDACWYPFLLEVERIVSIKFLHLKVGAFDVESGYKIINQGGCRKHDVDGWELCSHLLLPDVIFFGVPVSVRNQPTIILQDILRSVIIYHQEVMN